MARAASGKHAYRGKSPGAEVRPRHAVWDSGPTLAKLPRRPRAPIGAFREAEQQPGREPRHASDVTQAGPVALAARTGSSVVVARDAVSTSYNRPAQELKAAAAGFLAERAIGERPVRGGVSMLATITGALVVCAATALFILATLAVAAYIGYHPYLLPIGGTGGLGLTVAIGFALGLFVANFWGGYTAGRMGRGAGWSNGLLAAITAGVLLMVGLFVLVLVRPGPGLGITIPSELPKLAFRLPRWIDALLAAGVSILGATLGGIAGARWHGRIESQALKEDQETLEARQTFRDLREAIQEPVVRAPAAAIAPEAPMAQAPRPAPQTSHLPTFEPGITAG
ncbi:MAG: hypothetical protein NVSMB32_04460 [Actinomycetota bacterium]